MWWSIYEKKSGEGIARFEANDVVKLNEGVRRSGGEIIGEKVYFGCGNFRIVFRLSELGMEVMR